MKMTKSRALLLLSITCVVSGSWLMGMWDPTLDTNNMTPLEWVGAALGCMLNMFGVFSLVALAGARLLMMFNRLPD